MPFAVRLAIDEIAVVKQVSLGKRLKQTRIRADDQERVQRLAGLLAKPLADDRPAGDVEPVRLIVEPFHGQPKHRQALVAVSFEPFALADQRKQELRMVSARQ